MIHFFHPPGRVMNDFSRNTGISDQNWKQIAFFMILALTGFRVLALIFSPVELYQDETQYWIWSQTFDWGYFSKPPMIAWLIALSTTLFGDADFAVRLPAPLLHAGTASFLFLIGRKLWDARTGFWASLAYLTMPAIWISGGVISTDALLLCAWSGGLLALLTLREHASWPAALGFGAAIGLGFLSKYAMIYFVIGTGLALIFDPATRKALLNLRGLAAAVIAMALILPNILWNAANDFATVSHTAANANWGGALGNPDELLEFVSGQLGVFGPVFFLVLLAVAWTRLPRFRDHQGPEFLLLLYTLPPLLTVSVQAFISRAHANWAAAAYVAGTLLVVSFLLRDVKWRKPALLASIAFHSVLGLFVLALAASPALVEATGMSNSTKRIRAWQETGDAFVSAGNVGDYTAIVFDDRNIFHQAQRYASDLEAPVRMWWRYAGPVNHAEQGWPLEDGHTGPVLIISHRPLEVARMQEDFARFESAGAISIPLDGDKTREFTLWRAEGYQRIVRDAAYEERWNAVDAEARD